MHGQEHQGEMVSCAHTLKSNILVEYVSASVKDTESKRVYQPVWVTE